MADDLQPEYDYTPGPHPYLLEPILYISNLAPYVTETDLSYALEHCVPYRPRIPRDDPEKPLSGTIEFKLLEKGTCAEQHLLSLVSDSLAVVYSREGTRNTARAPRARRVAASAHKALALPAHPPYHPACPVRLAAYRQAAPARLHRLPAVRPLPPIWPARVRAHAGRVRRRERHGRRRVLARGGREGRRGELALRGSGRPEYRRAGVPSPQAHKRVGI